ncbi:MAG: hypothetical protein ACYC3O_12035 [Burkholderiales bacterium]
MAWPALAGWSAIAEPVPVNSHASAVSALPMDEILLDKIRRLRIGKPFLCLGIRILFFFVKEICLRAENLIGIMLSPQFRPISISVDNLSIISLHHGGDTGSQSTDFIADGIRGKISFAH